MEDLSFRREFRALVFGSVVYLMFIFLRWTWRLKEDELSFATKNRIKKNEPVVFAHLHEDEWALLGYYGNRQMNVLISHSKDGDIMACFLRLLGFQVCRGSSSRGAVRGLLELIKVTKNSQTGKSVSLAVDGPRGPRREAKEGVIKLAEKLNAPIVITGVVASRAWVFKKSWSKAFIPKPFSKMVLKYTELDHGASVDASTISRELIRVKLMAQEALLEKIN